MAIPKCKLNTCAHCKSQINLEVVFSKCGKMYFLCPIHKMMLDELNKSFEEGLRKIEAQRKRYQEMRNKFIGKTDDLLLN